MLSILMVLIEFSLHFIFFRRFDPQSKVWSTDKIDCVMDARYIVGLKDELYFVGCGYNRLMVRSYHFGQKEWTARGNLRHENKDTGFKAITMNGSIYVVMCKPFIYRIFFRFHIEFCEFRMKKMNF